MGYHKAGQLTRRATGQSGVVRRLVGQETECKLKGFSQDRLHLGT